MSELTLTEQEIVRLSGGYTRQHEQLRELHKLGYYRARRGMVTGEVILERAHVEAVASGLAPANESQLRNRPKLRAVK